MEQQRAFKEAMYQANLLYGVEFNDETDFEEIALIGYQQIGNQNVRYYRYKSEVNKEDNSIDLPCNVEQIEAVTIPMEDYNHVDGANINGDISTAFTENYIEARKFFHNPIYQRGKFVNYNRVGNKLYFEHPYLMVEVLYEGQELDDEGLPYLTDNEVDALAAYIAYAKKYKEGLQTMNQSTLTLAEQLRSIWIIKCDHARVPKHLDQNTMNLILDAKSNWNRKVYGKSFKPVMK